MRGREGVLNGTYCRRRVDDSEGYQKVGKRKTDKDSPSKTSCMIQSSYETCKVIYIYIYAFNYSNHKNIWIVVSHVKQMQDDEMPVLLISI